MIVHEEVLCEDCGAEGVAEEIGVTPETLTYYWNTDDCPISAFYKIAQLISYTVSYTINSK